MKRKQKILVSIITAAAAIFVFAGVWYVLPKTFLRGAAPSDVRSVSVFDGNTGKSFSIEEPEEIQYIVENIQGVEMKRDTLSLFYTGYGFRLGFYDEEGKQIESFIINSADTIRDDPFFYRCDGGLCFDYLKELEER